MSDTTVRINTVGSSVEVSIEPGQTVSDALAAADIDAEAAGLDVEVNGAEAQDDAPLEAGDQVVATPKNVKLG